MEDSNILIPSMDDPSSLQAYHIRGEILLRLLIFSLIGLLGMLAILPVGIWRWQYAASHFGPAVIWRWIAPALFTGFALGLVGAVSLIHLLRLRRIEVQISPMGLTIRKGRKLDTIPWKEIESIRTISIQYGILGLIWARRMEVILQLRSGRRITFNQTLENVETIINRVKQHVYPQMFRNLQLAYNRGEPIQFGPLTLTSKGILNGRKVIRWQDIGEIKLEHGKLQLQPISSSRHPKFAIQAHKIPNVDLCIQLLHHLGPRS
jgi:hypothetical protein